MDARYASDVGGWLRAGGHHQVLNAGHRTSDRQQFAELRRPELIRVLTASTSSLAQLLARVA